MKNCLKLIAVVAVAVIMTGCNCFSKMAKKQDQVNITCTPEVLVLNNGKVEADVTVTFPAKYYNPKAVIKVTSTGGDLSDYIYWFGRIPDPFWANSTHCGGTKTTAEK